MMSGMGDTIYEHEGNVSCGFAAKETAALRIIKLET